MAHSDQHLIIIRGNSGSGKSTLARMLQLHLGRSAANIGQDHFRRLVLRAPDQPDNSSISLIRSTALECFALGYHVIIEGILREAVYGDMLRQLYAEHPGPRHVFYIDVPLEVVLERHEQKPLRAKVEPETVAEWYLPHDVLGVDDEVVLDTSSMTKDEALAVVLSHVGDAAIFYPE